MKAPRFRGVLTFFSRIAITGESVHRSSWFATRKEAEDWIYAMRDNPWAAKLESSDVEEEMDAIIHTILVILGVSVSFDTVAAHGGTGFGYRIGDRSYTAGGFDTLAAARRAAPRHIRRTIAAREKAREANERRMREMRTIGKGMA